MTLPRFYQLCEYWRDHPPVHRMVAAYLGIGGKQKKGDLGDLVAMFGPQK